MIKPEDHVATLLRRAKFIDEKIKNHEGSEVSINSYIRELSALRFAINVLIAFLGYDAPEKFLRESNHD
jgi:hypothetical protein